VVALLLGCLFMFMILASLFESLVHPFTVMVAVPLAATGAVLSLLIFGKSMDLYGGIAMVLLAGLAAKNSILLVDFALQKIRQGTAPYDAVLEASPLRLRPILMTSFALIAGMIPVATGWGVGGVTRQSLGIATIGGVISSTLLTLVIVPNMFILVERLRMTWTSSHKKN
jgi:HAE1 family hydrophobic/amphiphilic exporter-1